MMYPFVQKGAFLKAIACVLFACCLALPAGPDDVPQSAVRILRAMTKDIQGCPEALVSESKWGKKPNEIEQWLYGPPKNVIWNAGKSTTPVRSPYEAYIEFSVSYFKRVPPETRDKYEQSLHMVSPFLGDWKIRYEFDVSDDDVTMTKALKRFETSSKWSDLDRNTNFCWDNIPRKSY
jgi:hypothetical protein